MAVPSTHHLRIEIGTPSRNSRKRPSPTEDPILGRIGPGRQVRVRGTPNGVTRKRRRSAIGSKTGWEPRPATRERSDRSDASPFTSCGPCAALRSRRANPRAEPTHRSRYAPSLSAAEFAAVAEAEPTSPPPSVSSRGPGPSSQPSHASSSRPPLPHPQDQPRSA
jgi:hypothetical protein